MVRYQQVVFTSRILVVLRSLVQLQQQKNIIISIQVEKWIKTYKKKELHIEVQKSNGFWWSTKAEKIVTNTKQISIIVNSGEGDYRLVIYDTAESTGNDKPPLYHAKSTKYSGSITGL